MISGLENDTGNPGLECIEGLPRVIGVTPSSLATSLYWLVPITLGKLCDAAGLAPIFAFEFLQKNTRNVTGI